MANIIQLDDTVYQVWTWKQNRESTEGCSKSLVRKNNDTFGKWICLNK